MKCKAILVSVLFTTLVGCSVSPQRGYSSHYNELFGEWQNNSMYNVHSPKLRSGLQRDKLYSGPDRNARDRNARPIANCPGNCSLKGIKDRQNPEKDKNHSKRGDRNGH